MGGRFFYCPKCKRLLFGNPDAYRCTDKCERLNRGK